jgi:tol-pal system protein YbgF
MRCFPLLLIALIALGCASSGDVSQVRQDVTAVYGEQTTYREKTDARLSRLEKDTKDLQRNLGSPDTGLRKQVVDLSLSAAARDEKIRSIYGRLDELESQLRSYWEEVKGELRALKDELRDLKRQREIANSGSAPASKTNPDELYKQGFDAYQKGAWEDAAQTFSRFVQQNPVAPLAPNAYFWTGESYMNLKNYEKAIVQFQELVDIFPNSDKAGRAMLRQAEAFGALGDKKSSTTLFKRVIELFPKSEEARVAERRLRGGTLQ